MGNYTSSTSNTATAKLVDARGSLRRVNLPVKAAELMLEHPGDAVSSAADLRSGRRVTALRADEDLSPGRLYLMVPIGRINSKLSDSEIEALSQFSKRNKSIAGRRSRSKVSPAAATTREVGLIGAEEEREEEDLSRVLKIQNQYRRQWNPVLESINEY